MKTIAVLGSTGSIGRQTLDVLRAHPELGRVGALAAHGNVELLLAQAQEFHPAFVGIADEAAAAALRPYLPAGTRLAVGNEAASEAAALPEADTVVNGVSGFAGTEPLLAALAAGKTVALANKESIVCAHKLVDEALRHGGRIVPVDSEQSAIFQCLSGGAHGEVARLWLTASGGPFRTFSKERLRTVTAADALRHPTWNMGAKITIDSATLFNKGLEIMEASYLFGIDGARISVLVHPESIVHSMVEFCDASVLAQLSRPDMHLAIHYALTWPERAPSAFGALNLAEVGRLTFEAPDEERFPSIPLAYAALREGELLPIAYNAANEAAVARFCAGEIGFFDVFRTVEYAMAHMPHGTIRTFADILETDREARSLAEKAMEKKS